MISQAVFDTSEVLALKGVKHVVLSPGSRNAPLTISFARNPKIKIYNIVDERSAGFIALGICQKLKEPVAICCTSGTSLLNYAPAVAEAFYQNLPLIVISADRPTEWLDQRDGQTINQIGALQNFVKKSFELPADSHCADGAWEYNRKLNEAINLATTLPSAPVHINIPFREPFYPKPEVTLTHSDSPRIILKSIGSNDIDLTDYKKLYHQYEKVLIICGQQNYSTELNDILDNISNAVIISDVIANTTGNYIRHHDLFLSTKDEKKPEQLQPDLIISVGKSVISKSLKTYLREYKAKAHWHIDEAGEVADTFQQLTNLIECNAERFFKEVCINREQIESAQSNDFVEKWSEINLKTRNNLQNSLQSGVFCEFRAFAKVLENLPSYIDLHLANSMPVRYANFIQDIKNGTEVFCNRGTSGIDGTNGTAVGNALVSDRQTWLLTGDLSFFYDRNAFFHSHDFAKLKIVVFNNHGGGIFRLIPGPANLPELQQHFETRHSHTAKFTAIEYGFDYFSATENSEIERAISQMNRKSDRPQLLEIFTDPNINSLEYGAIKKAALN